MQVNSIIFWGFFIVVLIPYFTFLRKSNKAQNWLLLVASYFFYGWADWRMLPLLLIVTIVYYSLGKNIQLNIGVNDRRASKLTTLGVVLGVGVLVYFKYLGFLVEQMATLLTSIGLSVHVPTLKIIMPVGVSFFTFKLIGYVIEVHRQKLSAVNDFVAFATFISFFPTIMSGPIDRAEKFMPQLSIPRKAEYDHIVEGLKLVLWGLFTKMCIADTIASYTDAVFNNYTHHGGMTIIFTSCIYAIQVYADFSGYSNMAIGVAKVLGLEVAENFNRPFFAQNVSELWRRWHMSLTTWITDYVFMPLNVKWRELGKWGLYLATLVNLIVIGLWHGANWTYVFFGIYQTIILIAILEIDAPRKKFEKKHHLKNNEIYKWTRRGLTFILWVIGDMIFRSATISDFFGLFNQIGKGFGEFFVGSYGPFTTGLLSIAILFYKEFNDEYKRDRHFLHSKYSLIRVVSVGLLISYILLLGKLDGAGFIYFQF